MSVLDDIKITYMKSVFAPNEFRTVPLLSALSAIDDGRWAEEVLQVRCESDPKKRKKLKDSLPAFVFQGTFKNSVVSENIETYSGIVLFDFDNIPIDKMEYVCEKLEMLDGCAFYFLSPSGNGLKVGMLSYPGTVESRESYKAAFLAYSSYLTRHLRLEPDMSGSDLARKCFVSYSYGD